MSNNSKIQEWEFTDYINSLVVRDESVDLEFKTASEGFPNSLWETYSAFANTDGGVIVLGVREKKNNLIVEGLTSEQIQQYKKRFWNEVNNPDCISFNLLTDKDIFEGEYEGKKLLLISIPRANRSQRPVYCTRNPFRGHTYKRNNEGDYKCTNEEVKRMIADADDTHPRDSRIMSNYSMDDIDTDSLKQYRQYFVSKAPSHPWLALNDIDLLEKLGGYRKDRELAIEGFTLAEILMFGKTESITDPTCTPNYFPDYRAYEEDNELTRWSDRICPDGTWEANLFQFYRRVYPKLVNVLPKPFHIKNGMRQDDLPTHIALREAFINTLIHCDYSEEGNIVIEQYKNNLRPSNIWCDVLEYQSKKTETTGIREISEDKAGILANLGYVVIACWKNTGNPDDGADSHPHFATVAPLELLPDDLTKGEIHVANVGGKCGFYSVTKAFGLKAEIRYYYNSKQEFMVGLNTGDGYARSIEELREARGTWGGTIYDKFE